MPIEFEHHEMLEGLVAAVENIAKTTMRPYSRECDEGEHVREPTEFIQTMWEVLKSTGGGSTSPVMGAKQEGEKRRRTGNVTSVAYVEQLAWGDCGMYLSMPMALLDGDQGRARRHQAVGGVAAGRVGDHAEDPAVQEGLLLRELGTVGEGDLGVARLDDGEARADQVHRLLAREARTDARGEIRVAGLELARGVHRPEAT